MQCNAMQCAQQQMHIPRVNHGGKCQREGAAHRGPKVAAEEGEEGDEDGGGGDEVGVEAAEDEGEA